jgi:hypothetical protein
MSDDNPPGALCVECGQHERERGDWCVTCWNELVNEEMRKRGIPIAREDQP